MSSTRYILPLNKIKSAVQTSSFFVCRLICYLDHCVSTISQLGVQAVNWRGSVAIRGCTVRTEDIRAGCSFIFLRIVTAHPGVIGKCLADNGRVLCLDVRDALQQAAGLVESYRNVLQRANETKSVKLQFFT